LSKRLTQIVIAGSAATNQSQALVARLQIHEAQFTSTKQLAWCEQHGINLHFTQPGNPMQN